MSLLRGLLPRLRSRDDRVFFLLHLPMPLLVFLLLGSMLAVLLAVAYPVIQLEGLSVFTSNVWVVNEEAGVERYGLAAAIFGTLYTSLIAVLIAAPLSVALALAIEELVPRRLRGGVELLVDLMAATPTIVYGVWGAVYLAPMVKRVLAFLHEHLGWLPFFSVPPRTEYTIGTAGVLLGIMVVPYAAAVIREAYSMIPWHLREAVYSVGATRFEAMRVLLGAVKPSIVAGLVLAYGRAMGETVAVSLVVGNARTISPAVTVPGVTVSSLIASNYKSVAYYEYLRSALFAGGLVLFIIGFVVNMAGILYMKRWEERLRAG